MRFDISVKVQKMAIAAMEPFADCLWHNMCPEDTSDLPPTTKGYLAQCLGLGIARAYGWIEFRDDTWVRVTREGKIAIESFQNLAA